jgi:hypothetical protein
MSFWMAQMQFFNQKNYIYAIPGENRENTKRCSNKFLFFFYILLMICRLFKVVLTIPHYFWTLSLFHFPSNRSSGAIDVELQQLKLMMKETENKWREKESWEKGIILWPAIFSLSLFGHFSLRFSFLRNACQIWCTWLSITKLGLITSNDNEIINHFYLLGCPKVRQNIYDSR